MAQSAVSPVVEGRRIRDDWTPVRSGIYYCSAACGGGRYCLHADYLKATKRAKKLAEELTVNDTAKFVPNVWENMGWHYSVTLELTKDVSVEVHAHDSSAAPTHYSVFIQADPQIVESGYGILKLLRAAIKRYDVYARQASNNAKRLTTLQLPVSIKGMK